MPVTGVMQDLERRGSCHHGAFVEVGTELADDEAGGTLWRPAGAVGTGQWRETWLPPERPQLWEGRCQGRGQQEQWCGWEGGGGRKWWGLVFPRGLSSVTPLLFERLCFAPWSPVSPVCLLSGRSTLSRCCNAPSFLFTTQKNTPLGTKLKYEVDTSGIYHINQEIFRMFPKVLLWAGRPGCGEEPAQHGPLWLCPRGLARLCCARCTHCPALVGHSLRLSRMSPGSLVWHSECQLAISWVAFGKKVVVKVSLLPCS